MSYLSILDSSKLVYLFNVYVLLKICRILTVQIIAEAEIKRV